MKPNAVVWFEIYVNEISRAKKFYESVLAVQLKSLQSGEELKMWAFPSAGPSSFGAGGALVKMEGYKAGGNGTIVYFGSEDCSVEEKRVIAAGGKIHKSKFSIGEFGFIALAVDTEGNVFGLHSMK